MKNYYKKIGGFSNYQIWSNGNIISEITGQIMGHVQPNGYIRMTLTDDDAKQHSFYGHHLVWFAFKGEIQNGKQINHINECKSDNSIWNLEVLTPAENNAYGTAKARRSLTMRMNTIYKRLDAVPQIKETILTLAETNLSIAENLEHRLQKIEEYRLELIDKLEVLQEEQIELVKEIEKFERKAKKRVM